MIDKDLFKARLKNKLFHKSELEGIKRSKKHKLKLPVLPISLIKVIDEEIELENKDDFE